MSQIADIDLLSHRSEDMHRARAINRDSMIFESASYREKKEDGKKDGQLGKTKSNSSVIRNANAPQTKV